MHYENKEYPKEIKHFVSLTAEDIRLAVKEIVKKEYPNVPRRPLVTYGIDMFGMVNATVEWTEIER